MIVIKILLLLFSISISIVCMINLSKLPKETSTPERNLKDIFKYSYLSFFVDFGLIWIMAFLWQGEVYVEANDIIVWIVLLVYGIPCIYISVGIKKRIKKYFSSVPHDLHPNRFKYIDMFSVTIFTKLLFVIIEYDWIVGTK